MHDEVCKAFVKRVWRAKRKERAQGKKCGLVWVFFSGGQMICERGCWGQELQIFS